jgi:hypothetical protein
MLQLTAFKKLQVESVERIGITSKIFSYCRFRLQSVAGVSLKLMFKLFLIVLLPTPKLPFIIIATNSP